MKQTEERACCPLRAGVGGAVGKDEVADRQTDRQASGQVGG